MHNQSIEPGPVGVVPRRQARDIEALMSDQPDTCTVAEDVASPSTRTPALLPQWLSSVATFGIVAAALEWLKLTR